MSAGVDPLAIFVQPRVDIPLRLVHVKNLAHASPVSNNRLKITNKKKKAKKTRRFVAASVLVSRHSHRPPSPPPPSSSLHRLCTANDSCSSLFDLKAALFTIWSSLYSMFDVLSRDFRWEVVGFFSFLLGPSVLLFPCDGRPHSLSIDRLGSQETRH